MRPPVQASIDEASGCHYLLSISQSRSTEMLRYGGRWRDTLSEECGDGDR
jgi:hypothetical protein